MNRLKSYVFVEDKSFDLEWWKDAPAFEEVGITERCRGRVFTCLMFVSAVRWIGKLLAQMSVDPSSNGSIFKGGDDLTSLIATLRENSYGRYVQILIGRTRSRVRGKCLCFPAGVNMEGWATVGAKIRGMFQELRNHRILQPNVGVRRDNPPMPDRDHRSYATVCEGFQNRTTDPQVMIHFDGPVRNASWWTPVVFCKFEGGQADWKWVGEKIQRVCQEATFKMIEGNDAMISFQSENEAAKILQLPILQSWDGRYVFRKWNPTEGSLSLEEVTKKAVNVMFKGILYHLRDTWVMESLAKKCSPKFHFDKANIGFLRSSVPVKLIDCDMRKIPRFINLDERGYKFWVQVVILEEAENLGRTTTMLPENAAVAMILEDGRKVPTLPVVQVHVADTRHTSDMSRPPGFDHKIVQYPHAGTDARSRDNVTNGRVAGDRGAGSTTSQESVVGGEHVLFNRFEPLSMIEDDREADLRNREGPLEIEEAEDKTEDQDPGDMLITSWAAQGGDGWQRQ
ncbi:hypothetical protein FRX31_014893 [Thalictrum thalictroides]|uniref:Uncharacterized protein n=1 Tax=Thalictrum thalictroides TaxID=46969 RepID=A0A7J6WG05_THATH|nr:hypothetical protein FRX31_014893 [Thalictrum thalictroides]